MMPPLFNTSARTSKNTPLLPLLSLRPLAVVKRRPSQTWRLQTTTSLKDSVSGAEVQTPTSTNPLRSRGPEETPWPVAETGLSGPRVRFPALRWRKKIASAAGRRPGSKTVVAQNKKNKRTLRTRRLEVGFMANKPLEAPHGRTDANNALPRRSNRASSEHLTTPPLLLL